MKHLDAFGHQLPRWVNILAPKNCTTAQYCLTYTQLLHLGVSRVAKPLQFVNFVSSVDWCGSCLTQCREHMYIHDRFGEAWNINITVPYLSTDGTPLTEDPRSIRKLDKCSQYSTPFWITEEETTILSRHLPDDFNAFHSSNKFHTHSVPIRTLRGDYIPVVNVEEVISTSSAMNLRSFLSLFRVFQPISIKTRQPFPSSIALLLRIECWRTRCWCSIWGTEEDFSNENISCLDGALSVNVFTEHGNELALTNGLRTSNSAEVYRIVFPEAHLSFFC